MNLKGFIIINLLIHSLVFSQKTLPVFSNDLYYNNKTKINNDKAFSLIMVSSPFCGYCRIAKQKLYQLFKEDGNNLNIIIYNFNGKQNTKKIYENSDVFKTFIFIDAEKDENKTFDRLFLPRFYLYKNNALIWKQKGYTKNTIKKIKKKITSK